MRVHTRGARSTGPRRATLLVLGVLALLVAACGTRLSEEERALYTGGNDETSPSVEGTGIGSDDRGSTRSSTRPTSDGGTGSGTDTGGTGGENASEGGGQGASSEGGQEGAGAGQDAAGQEGCAASASGEKGVTDETITIGNVSQLSGPVPGFAQKAVNGAQAYVAFVNATGGLCGRELVLEVADDAFDASRNASEVSRLEPRVLAFGASFSVSDSGFATELAGTNVLDVGIATSPERQQYENYYTHLPGQTEPVAAPEWKYASRQGATKGIIVHVAAAAARNEAENVVANMREVGIEAERLEISNTQFSFAGPARNVMDSGADIMVFISDLNASVQMVTEMRELGPPLPFEWYRIAYGQEFLDRAGSLAEGTMAFLEFLPFEEAGQNEEMARYQEWLARVAPDSSPSFDSINSWIAMKMLVQAIRGVEGDLTRDGLLASMQRITSYDAGGLIEEMNPAGRQTGRCKLAVRVQDGAWVREAPPSGFLC